MYILVTIRFSVDNVDYTATGTILVPSKFDSWLVRYGTENSGLYINEYSAFYIDSAKFTDEFSPIRISVTDDDVSGDEYDEYDIGDITSDFLNEIVAENIDDEDDIGDIVSDFLNEIVVESIDDDHMRCQGSRICGCGCDELHDGDAGFCEPYPMGCKRIRAR